MAGSIKYKSVSTDFAVFLNTFLIISTVIVFAVLVFISYMNISNEFMNNSMSDGASVLADAVHDVVLISDAYEDEKTREDLIDIYLRSNIISDNGAIFFTYSDGTIKYSNSYPLIMTDVNSVITSSIAAVNVNPGEIYQAYNNVTAMKAQVISACKVSDTGLYAIAVSEVDLRSFIGGYMNIFLYPILVSMVAAIALFIGFTGLTIRPLREISETMSKVAAGDLSARVDKKYTKIGDSTGMLTLSSDLTELARNVNDMIEDLENQENDRSMFISSVAHDIRTPLTSINGFVTAMMDGTIPPELYDKYLMRIKSEVDRIRSLVVSMTEASSLSNVSPDLMDSFDLKEACDDMIADLEPQLRAKSITAETRINPEGGTEVYGEIQLLCRVLFNIVTNAIKFTPDGGKIIISSNYDRKQNVRMISVEDSGPGVEPDKRNRVFESFYKADPSRKQEGFGLGLYICKQILMGHEQNIWLDESPELGGAMFVFSFPVPPKKD